VEMFAQDRLWQAFGANRGQVPEEALPQEARQRLLERGVRPQDGKFKVALSNAFELLRFAPQSELQGSSKVYERLRSHLEKRNGSILAHGIVPLDEEGYEAMEAAVWSALEIEEGDVPMWPEIRLSLD
ncbi:MAG: hypothetical protein N2109_02275, partial [Fimbriimonadales bacterium]|nr:hypothetical protein [Fimbriimonadales bacterium]